MKLSALRRPNLKVALVSREAVMCLVVEVPHDYAFPLELHPFYRFHILKTLAFYTEVKQKPGTQTHGAQKI